MLSISRRSVSNLEAYGTFKNVFKCLKPKIHLSSAADPQLSNSHCSSVLLHSGVNNCFVRQSPGYYVTTYHCLTFSGLAEDLRRFCCAAKYSSREYFAVLR